jgi:UDP-glucose 4-epimerase
MAGGTCIRDYVHVSDLARPHVAALDWLAKGRPSQSINLGNGRGFSVAEAVQTTEKVTGRPVQRRCVRAAPVTLPCSLPSPDA